MNSFSELIGQEYSIALENKGIKEPTKIQRQAMPIIISGADVAACSPTGTGKTLTYLLPVFQKADLSIKTPQVIIIAPTRELAAQVFKHAKEFRMDENIGIALMAGGGDLKRQIERLKDKPQIIIGTAGRVLELIRMKKLSAHTVKTIVIDEADRMLDDNNIEQVKALVKTTQRDRQLLFFSASIEGDTMNRINSMSKEPQLINITGGIRIPDNIEHMYMLCEKRNKIDVMRKIISTLEIKKALVFLNNPDEIENMAKRLNYHGIKTAALFGTGFKKERKQALNDFINGRATLLVASDIAARGLDVKELTYVIQLDMPENPIFYLHRVGRAGRMQSEGYSIVIAEKRELALIKKCEKKFGIKIMAKDLRYGKLVEKSPASNNTLDR